MFFPRHRSGVSMSRILALPVKPVCESYVSLCNAKYNISAG
ncbi:hypothetical protein DLM_3458 [Aquitalea magnusonii]|uniref:Uncharacterized protein n=1 Tax=Aquitalea magnusonii TaxID=332411 RepID=A0A3G9GQJ3_9NEIS|nr:hypothetical protein DLM_3458 [Aquitalea magnusonii]